MPKIESNQPIGEQNKGKPITKQGWDKRYGYWKQLDSQTDSTLYSSILLKEKTIYLLKQYKLCNNDNEGNRYLIKNNFNENLLYGVEKSNCSDKLCLCSHKRSFSLTFFDVNRVPVFVLKRPFRISCCCGLIPCCRQKIEVKDNSNKTIGEVIEKCSLFRVSVNVCSEQTELSIFGPKCQIPFNYCLDDLCFEIKQKTDNQTLDLGHICKFCELTNGGHIYKIVLNVETSPQIKSLIIGATILIDYNYFDNAFHEHKYHSLTMSSVSQTLPPFPMIPREDRHNGEKSQ